MLRFSSMDLTSTTTAMMSRLWCSSLSLRVHLISFHSACWGSTISMCCSTPIKRKHWWLNLGAVGLCLETPSILKRFISWHAHPRLWALIKSTCTFSNSVKAAFSRLTPMMYWSWWLFLLQRLIALGFRRPGSFGDRGVQPGPNFWTSSVWAGSVTNPLPSVGRISITTHG